MASRGPERKPDGSLGRFTRRADLSGGRTRGVSLSPAPMGGRCNTRDGPPPFDALLCDVQDADWCLTDACHGNKLYRPGQLQAYPYISRVYIVFDISDGKSSVLRWV